LISSRLPCKLQFTSHYNQVLITNLREFRLLVLENGVPRKVEGYQLAESTDSLFYSTVSEDYGILFPEFLERVLRRQSTITETCCHGFKFTHVNWPTPYRNPAGSLVAEQNALRYCSCMFFSRSISALALFCSAAVSAQVVINSGVPGENSAEVLQRTPLMLRANKPEVVVLFIGMNDAVNEKKFLSPEQTKANVLTIVRYVKAAGAIPVVVSVHAPDDTRLLARHDPKIYADRSPSQRIDLVNEALSSIARDQHLTIADFHSALQAAGGANLTLSTDGVHMTVAGYELLAKTILAALPKQARRGTIVCLGDSLTYGIGVRASGSEKEGSDTYPAQLRLLLSQPGEAPQ
jgi:lysophospholipase L1-like esterase